MNKTLARLLKKLLASRGYTVVNTASMDFLHRMEDASIGIARRGHGLRSIIDVGASNGGWSGPLMKHLPDCRYLLIEAQPVHQPALEAFVKTHPNAEFTLAAAGRAPGQIHFDASDPFGGVASPKPFPANDLLVPVTTIDREVKARSLPGPYLIKLDTHGFEVPILEGAKRTLKETEVLVVECYNFKVAPEGLLFFEMCSYLWERGFRCVDLVDPLIRPLDGAFWQMDLVFIRRDRPEFDKADYS